jgi:hypothetical protein
VVARPLIPSWVLPVVLILVLAMACLSVGFLVLEGVREGAPPEAAPGPEQPVPTEGPPGQPTQAPPDQPTEPPPEQPTVPPPDQPTEPPPEEPPPSAEHLPIEPDEGGLPCAPLAGGLVLAPLAVFRSVGSGRKASDVE